MLSNFFCFDIRVQITCREKKRRNLIFHFLVFSFFSLALKNSLLLNQIRLTKYELFVVSWQQELVDVVAVDAVDAVVVVVVVVGLR